jgi:hypothetical protein
MLEVDIVMVAIRMAMIAPASAKVTALMRVPTPQLAE